MGKGRYKSLILKYPGDIMLMKINKIHCKSCDMLVTDILEDAGAKNIKVSHENGTAEYEGDINMDIVKKEITEAGFEVQQ